MKGDRHRDARQLLLGSRHGVLSTLSGELDGHPFGSLVPYCAGAHGAPLILISDIAEHTRNIGLDPRVSLTVAAGGDDPQAAARLTLLASAQRVTEGRETEAARYYRFFPPARGYHTAHAFELYRLEPLRLRYIGGFGDIRWLDGDQVVRANPFGAAAESAILEHMNRDHQSALRHYCRSLPAEVVAGGVEMVGIDGDGFDLRLGKRLVRRSFGEPIATPGEARAALTALAREVGEEGENHGPRSG